MFHWTYTLSFILLAACIGSLASSVVPIKQAVLGFEHKNAQVLILGGGVAGVIAARTLHEQGIDDIVIIEAGPELGGRMMSHEFGGEGNRWTVEVGANWVQGTQTGDGPANPIWTLARKHNISLHPSDYFGSVGEYDYSGPVDFQNISVCLEGDTLRPLDPLVGARVPQRLVDMTARSGYSLSGARPETPHARAAEYYQFDWEFGATPEETSWLASAWVNIRFFPTAKLSNLTFSIDQRGFKALIKEEADDFLDTSKVLLNSTVVLIERSKQGIVVTLNDQTKLVADYVLCTFSLGVPITKIFIQFPHKFNKLTRWHCMPIMNGEGIPSGSPSTTPGCSCHLHTSLTLQGEFSRRIESMSDLAVQKEVLSVLRTMYPNATIPDPVDFHFKRWNSDPLFRGSFSNWPANFLSEHQVNLRANVGQRLWFAGEATSKKHFGYLHGALSEGHDIAMLIARCIHEGVDLGLEHVDRVRNALPYDVA